MTDPALLALLRFDPARDAQPLAKARILRRLEMTLGAAAAMASRASSRAPESSSRSSPDTVAVSRVQPPPSVSPLRTASVLAGKPVALVTAAFLLGGASGAGLYAALAPRSHRTLYVERPISVPEPRPFALGPPAGGAEPPRDVETTESSKTRGNPATAVTGLAAERHLLDRARKALARGDTAEAEQALDLHVRRYPAGLLLEEREALAVKVLVDLGRADEARRRAVKFRERYPRSLFGPAVDEAIGTIP